MDCYKTMNSDRIYKISFDNYEKDPGFDEPYFVNDTCYALCPACDNPIQICALYKKKENSPKPYGRHTGKDIKDFAPFDSQKYDFCPYASHRKGYNNYDELIKDDIDQSTIEALELLRDNFDKVIYLVKKESGIKISNNFAKEMLVSFLGNGNENAGYLFYYFNKTNFPYLFAYRCKDFSLRGRYINTEAPLYNILKERNVKFSKDGQYLVSFAENPQSYVFSFIHYKIETIEGDIHETVKFCIFDKQRNIIFERKIIIDLAYINNLIKMENFKRNEELLNVAKELINERLEILQA